MIMADTKQKAEKADKSEKSEPKATVPSGSHTNDYARV